jgi:glycine cleavage system aminomethyltransferase T
VLELLAGGGENGAGAAAREQHPVKRFLERLDAGADRRLGDIEVFGGILCETTITRLEDDRFFLCSAGAAEWHDHQWMRQHLPDDGGVNIANVTARFGTLILAGPKARDVLGRITSADLSSDAFPWLSAQAIEIGFSSMLAMRINYVGELGWELHIPVENMIAVYEALMTRSPNTTSPILACTPWNPCAWRSATARGRST